MTRHVTLCGALLVLAALPTRADTVTLKNGREVHGRLVHEGRDSIRMRLPGGTITIPKRDVATFAEDDNWGDEYAALTPPLEPALDGAPQASAPRAGPAPGAGRAVAQLEPWVWAEGLSTERIAELTPLRDRLLEELRALGPTPAERLRATEATPEERARIDELIQLFAARRAHVRRQGEPGEQRAGSTSVRRGNWPSIPLSAGSFPQRAGSTNLRRANRRDEVVDFGPKAIGPLVGALGSDALWRKRIAAQALGQIATGGDGLDPADVRWLLYRADAPGALISVLGVQGETETDAPFVRQDADAALEAVTGQAVPFVPSLEPTPTAAEVEAAEAWRRWWTAERARFEAAEAAKEERRGELIARLLALRQGRAPTTGP